MDSEVDEAVVREMRAEEANRKETIAHDVKVILKEFYCEICDVQYKTVMQMEEHLNSYNHHHKKRFIEMKAMMKNPDETAAIEAREAQLAQREMQKAMAQASYYAAQQAVKQVFNSIAAN